MLASSPSRMQLRKRKVGIKSSPLKPVYAPPGKEPRDLQVAAENESLVQVEDSQAQEAQRDIQTQTKETQASSNEPDLSRQRLLVEQLQAQVNAISEDISTLENEIHRFQEPESHPSATQESNSKLW